MGNDTDEHTSMSPIERRWSYVDTNLDLSKYCPEYIKRLMETIYHEIDTASHDVAPSSQPSSCMNEETALKQFAQVNVIGQPISPFYR